MHGRYHDISWSASVDRAGCRANGGARLAQRLKPTVLRPLAGATMTTINTFRSTRLAVVCIVTIALPPGVLTHATPAQTATAAVAGEVAPWPRFYRSGAALITLYTPQIASWDGQKRMVAWTAVAYQAQDGDKPALGSVKLEANTRVSIDERLVNFSEFQITASSFPTLSEPVARGLVALLHNVIPEHERVIALDRVLAAVDKSAIQPKDVNGVKADPPRVLVSTRPAVLVALDGDPIWSPIRDVDLEFAVNTNWDLFRHGSTKTFYLRDETRWFKAAAIDGPWSPAGTLPASFGRLPADDNFKEVKANVPGKPIPAGAMPAVFVATEPAELLLLNGAPSYQPVAGTSLLWVSNTESDLFRAGKAGLFYYLVAGRWFSAPELSGPWTFATPSLPADFRKIPIDHARSRVLASVPGSDEAHEAVMLATIPETARVSRKLPAPDVAYEGAPEFQPIPPAPDARDARGSGGQAISRAVNTDKDIFKIGDRYYMCYQAVWFVSTSANGPWEVATSIPDVIYDIPASSPSHNVTYVTIEDDDPNDDWVTFAYVAGYTGMMIAWGCAVWGTGWYYPPYVRYGGFHPIYYPFPRTYGYSAWYNPYTGRYGRAAAVYGPYGGVGAAAVYNPRTGNYARGAAVYGPYGSRSVANTFNPRTGAGAVSRQGTNVYSGWSSASTSVRRGDDWARSGSTPGARSGAAARTTPARPAGGDVYAGHDGNVYRRNADGGWQNSTSGTTARDRPSTTTTRQLDRDAGARSTGTQRTQSLGTYRSAPSQSAAGSFRSGGGRSAGGRRGR